MISSKGEQRSSFLGRSNGTTPTPGTSMSTRQRRAAEPRRIGGRIGEDDDRRLQPLGAVDGHHPHLVGRRPRIALNVDRRRAKTRQGSGRARRSRRARTRARCSSIRRSGRAPPCRAASRACAGPRIGPDRIVSRNRDGGGEIGHRAATRPSASCAAANCITLARPLAQLAPQAALSRP